MSLIRVACNHGALRTDNVRRAIQPAPHWLSFVKFNHLAVIDICTESSFGRLDISRERIRSQLNSVRQSLGKIRDERSRGWEIRLAYDALVIEITGAGQIDIADITVSVKGPCQPFIGNRPTHMIPGSTELFLFPSLLYSQLAQFAQITGGRRTHTRDASARVLTSLRRIIEQSALTAKPEKILIDTSPFFGGATHLAWVAADALIVPVRVDQHSIEALRLTLEMLKNPDMDFQKFNTQAGLERHPKVHAIVMTHCGWNRQRPNTPDSSTRFFVERAISVAKEFADVFSDADVSKCFYLLDDFHSSGRISGKQRIPLAKLNKGNKHMVEGQRLEVNPSIERYKREVANLTAAL